MQEKRSTKGRRAKAFRAGKGIVYGSLRGKRAVLFTAVRQRKKGSLRQSYFSVQPRALCFTQHVWHLHVANAAVRRFCFLRRLHRNCFCTKGTFCKCGRGAVFRSRFFARSERFFAPSAVGFFKRFRSARRMSSNAKGVFSWAVKALFAAGQKVRRFSF